MAKVTPEMTPAMTEVSPLPSMYPVTERIDSSTTRLRRPAVVGRKRLRKPCHIRGDSSMVKKVRTAMVTIETTVEKAASPARNAVAGFSTLVSCEVSFAEPSERYFCKCRR